ncbi:MAG: hypothetical protein IT233_11890 [Bacteroidia bacterium]|nr:hypothetical protein [Bacteroidia bacterium]
MKHHLPLFILILAVAGMTAQKKESGDRSFAKGNQLMDGGFGLAFFGNSEITWKNPNGPHETDKDTVGSFIFPVRYQYGILDWLGVGGMLRFHNYIEGDKDSTNERAVGFDIGLRTEAHYLRTRRLDFGVGLGFGFSRGDWRWNDGSDVHVYGSGTHMDLDFIFRFYFSDHFGMNASYGRIFQTYPNVVGENTNGWREEYDFRFRGGSWLIGIHVKF